MRAKTDTDYLQKTDGKAYVLLGKLNYNKHTKLYKVCETSALSVHYVDDKNRL